MPFTTKEIVRKHIIEHHLNSTSIENEPVQMIGNDYVALRHRPILKDTEKVKGKEQFEPTREDVEFSGSDTVSLSFSELIPDTVVVAGDSSLGTIYIENVDYHVDYDIGSASRIPSGSIPPGGSVVIWYLYFRIYERGIDYDIDHQKGRLRRRTNGEIESNQRVLVDYQSEFSGLDDETMENAISEANDQIVAFIDDAYRDSSDRSLVTAETYLTVSIICRIKAMDSMSISPGLSNNSADAGSWSSLSETYKKEAYSLLAKYAGAIGAFKPPSKAR